MGMNPKHGFGSADFEEVAWNIHPRGIPKSVARGGGGVAVRNAKRYLAMMDKAVDYDLYDDDKLRYRRFKSPFDRRQLVSRRRRYRQNVAKRTLRLVGSSNPDYLLQWCEEAEFGDCEGSYGWEDEE